MTTQSEMAGTKAQKTLGLEDDVVRKGGAVKEGLDAVLPSAGRSIMNAPLLWCSGIGYALYDAYALVFQK